MQKIVSFFSKIRQTLLVLLLLYLAGSFLYFVFFLTSGIYYSRQVAFDSRQWINSPSSRNQMVEDLFNSSILMGMGKQKVLTALGPPDSVDKKGKDRQETLIYHLKYPLDDDSWLHVNLENEKVIWVENKRS